MKFKQLLTKTLLVAAGLCVGVSAWGQTTAFSQDFTAIGESTTPSDYGFALTYGSGSNAELVNFTVTDGVLKCVAGPYASSSAGARTGTATATFSEIGVGNEITLSYTWALGSATGNASGSYTETYIGNSTGRALDIKFQGSQGNGTLYVNGEAVKTGDTDIRNTTYTVTATINMNTQKITALTLDNSNNKFDYTASDAIAFASAITTIDRFAFENSERQNWGNTSTLDNILITYSEAREAVESFVVNYTYGGSVIASENIGVAGLYAGDSYTVPFRMYVQKDGALYKTTANSSGSYYRDVVTLTTNTVVNKTLSSVDLKGGTIELLEDLDDADSENASVRASYGLCYNNKAYTSSVTLSPGIYTFIVRALNKGRGSSIAVGSTTVTTIDNVNSSKGAWTDKTIENVEIPVAGKVTLVKGGSNTIDCYDIIIAIRTADYTVSVPCTNGFATYANHDYALDFTGVTGLTAYTATVSGTTVTFTKATQVPAGTGLLLKGETKDVPVIATAAAVDNLLYAPTTAVAGLNYDQDDCYNYILTQPAGKSVGFYQANNNSVAVGKAYLRISKSTGVREFSFIGLDGESETTGIQSMENGQCTMDNVYDLQGRRVAQPQKGLYIVNGKKVIMK